HALAHRAADLAIIAVDESGGRSDITQGELRALVGAAAAGLRRLGVERGDRVAAVLPNAIPAVVAFLATASLGAIWSSCAPEFGASSMVDRFRQIAPKVLLVADAYRYGGKEFDLAPKQAVLREALEGLGATVVVPDAWRPSTRADAGADVDGHAHGSSPGGEVIGWEELISVAAPLEFAQVPFEHPLWILYSSGTTGLPKPIVHGHGGIVLEHLKVLALHTDIGPWDRFFWFTTTGWMMWNFLVGGLLVGATIVCYDGSPVWPDQPRLWRMAAELAVTCFGTSAPYLESCRKAGVSPRQELDLSTISAIGSTGAPLSPEGFAWATDEVADDVLVGSVSGGTDVCTAFVGTCPVLPVHAGELQCLALGAKVESFDEDGHPIVGEVGELVVTEPMPSMPVMFWGDDDGSRLRASYFDTFPGVWRHGDWIKITDRGTCVLYGRSDATLNRGGVRMGTSEFYRVVEGLPGVAEALVVDTTQLGTEGALVLFVVPAGDGDGDMDALTERIRSAIREQLSPRHVPDRVLYVDAVPHTLNGKKVEVPVRKILLGAEPESALSADAMSDPGALRGLIEAIDANSLR
ncbi:MAG TPA: acetoacetate--CoA ligase, partial [Acidimicrobiales bacterium]|nr:acetoacetate--CoA ligase [Acidimicrobiales bacterium]